MRGARRRLRARSAQPAPEPDVPTQSRVEVLRGAGRRLLGLLALATGIVVAIALPLGLALGSGVSRSLSVGFYVLGSFLLVAGFFVGNRGPVRLKSSDDEAGSASVGLFGIGLAGRGLRWATPEENQDALASSAVFVTIGFVLIVFGVVADSRVELL